MPALVSQLAAALEGESIVFCHWKGAAALERALRGERDLDWLVRAADWQRALAVIEAAGWKRAVPRSGSEEPGIAHFFAYEPALEPLLHLHLHDRVLSGEDWINSHALPFDEDFLASPNRAHGIRVPSSAGEAALALLKHAIRWGSLPDRLTSWLRPQDETEELATLLVEPTLAGAVALVHTRCPALGESTLRACAAELLAKPDAGARRRLAGQVRRALRPWSRYGPAARALVYLRLAYARLRRWLDRERRERRPAQGPACFALVAEDAAQVARSAADLEAWLGQAFHVARREAAPGEVLLCVGGAASAPRRIDLARFGGSTPALRAALWETL